MDDRASAVGADGRQSEPDTLGLGRFARAGRRLAIEAHAVLNRPDAPTGELTKLWRRLGELLRASRDSRLTGIGRRLRSADRRLAARRVPRPAAEPRRGVPVTRDARGRAREETGVSVRPRPIGVVTVITHAILTLILVSQVALASWLGGQWGACP